MRQNTFYQLVRDVLAQNIESGKLPAGTRLYTAAVADRLGTSRPPAKRAIEMLVREGLLSALPKQGYQVGRTDADIAPVRENLHLLDLDLSLMASRSGTPLAPRWGEVHGGLKAELLKSIPFGTFQISESAVAEAFGVSRTVAHEALARLDAEGIVRKSRTSHWTAGPLSVRMLDEAHEIRILLEPAALVQAAPEIPRDDLLMIRTSLRNAAADGPALSIPRMAELEQALHVTCLSGLKNRRLYGQLMRLQLDHIVNELFRRHVTTPEDRDMIAEHALVVDHMLVGGFSGAGEALRYHLHEDHRRTRERLRVLSLFEEPNTAPWLSQLN